MSKSDMIYYEKPLLVVSLVTNRLFAKGARLKLEGEYLCSNGDKLALIEGESHLFSFDDFEAKGEWVDKPKKSEGDEIYE